MVMENQIAKGAEEHIFERHTPGQSLTNSKEQSYPWENPPEMNSVKEATQRIFLGLLEDKNLETVTDLMAEGTPIDDVAQMLLMTGFQKGKFNPDMMLQLLEPTMYMLLAIAEKVGIRPALDRPGEAEPEPNDEFNADTNLQTGEETKGFIGAGGRFKDAVVKNINPASVGGEIKNKLENLNVDKVKESILQKRKPTMQKQESLLGKTGV